MQQEEMEATETTKVQIIVQQVKQEPNLDLDMDYNA
jgi:hypothetical protein